MVPSRLLELYLHRLNLCFFSSPESLSFLFALIFVFASIIVRLPTRLNYCTFAHLNGLNCILPNYLSMPYEIRHVPLFTTSIRMLASRCSWMPGTKKFTQKSTNYTQNLTESEARTLFFHGEDAP